MNSSRPFFLVPAVLTSLFTLLFSAAQSQENEASSSLTFRQYPSSFHADRPFTANTEILLQFSEKVTPATAAQFLQFYDKPHRRVVGSKAKRPTVDEIKSYLRSEAPEIDPDRFILIKPANSLPLGGTWYLHAKQGLSSTSGSHKITESRLDYLASLHPFLIDSITARAPYDNPLQITLSHSKAGLAGGFDSAKVAEYIQVSPAPSDLKVESGRYRITLTGSFDYGSPYKVTLREGLIAHDLTQLSQTITETVNFQPNEGFVTYPAFAATQNATGHRRFDVRMGNLTGLRTRVKKLEGDQLILALHEYNQKYEGWGEEQALAFSSIPGKTIYDNFQTPSAKVDRTETVSLDWDALTEETQTGAFYLCSEGKSATREKREVGAQSLIQLTDIGLAWKQSSEETVIYAFSIRNGTPLPGAKVALTNAKAKVLAEATTDAQGLVSIDSKFYSEEEGDSSFYLDVKVGEDRHAKQFYERMNSMGLWSFSINQRYNDLVAGERRTLLFSDRNVYRPGDEVKLKAISRFVDEEKLLGPGTGDATLRVYDSRRRKIFEEEVRIDETGELDDSLTLPSSGMGWHTVELDFNPQNLEGHPDWRLITTHSFQVEDYRVNTFEIGIEHLDAYDFGEPIPIPISATYYMGKPLSKAEMQWNVYAYGEYPRPRGFDDFEFGNLTVDRESFSADGTKPLSSKGTSEVVVELPEQKLAPGPRRVSLTTQITDANQQTISRSASFTVDSSDFYLGLNSPDGVHRAGDKPTFSIAAVAADGAAYTAPVKTTLLIEKKIYNTVKVMGANGRMTYRNDQRLEMVQEETIELVTEVDAETGLTRALPHSIHFPEAGDYLITLTARDEKNRPVLTRTRFTVIGAEEPSWSWYDVIRIDMIPDKSSYKVGEIAKVLVRSPVFGKGLLTTERGGVRASRPIEINEYETVIEIPIQEGDAPNIFASAFLVRGSGQSPHVHTSADYRLGYTQIEVDDPASHLDVTLDSGAEPYYQPGEEVTVTANIQTLAGEGVANASVTFFAVDEGVLSLTGHQTPNPHELFHAAFPLSVRTGQSISELLPENPLEQDFGNKGYVIGGGGNGHGLDPDRIRKDFKALAFWEPDLKTDAEGKVTATFVAPDNLTTFRLMAVVSEGSRFGHGEAPVIINKPLIIEPALPVFTNLTDQIDVSAVLHNNTDKAQEVEVTVTLDDRAVFVSRIGESLSTNLSNDSQETQRTVRAILEAQATETLSFPIAMTSVGEAKWLWKATSITEERLRDATESTLQVGYPLPLLRESHSFTLKNGESIESVLEKVKPRLRTGTGKVEVSFSNSRLIEAADGLEYLLKYPYGCVEQTTSSLIPWLSTQQLRKVMPPLDKSPEHVASVTGKAIDRLFSMQTSDGGLGYWPGSNQSVLWGSAYAGVAIALAQQQGLEVPEDSADALWKYLSKNLRNTADLGDTYELSQRCLSTYALALAGRTENSYHEVLYQKRQQLSSEARALLALAMIEGGASSADRVESLLAPAEAVPVAEVTWYKRPYLAATRLLAQVRHDPDSDRVDTLLDELMALRQPLNGWGSTYSNAWPLIALANYSEAAAGSMEANGIEVKFRDKTEALKLAATPDSRSSSFSFEENIDVGALSISPSGNGTVYTTIRVETRPELMPIEPENNGFAIQRTYEKVASDGSISAAEDLEVGDLILVTLDVNIPHDRENYLAIDDALPAIFEAVNPTFKSQATQKVNQTKKRRTLYTHYREIRKDRVLFFADQVFRSGDYSLQYLARVVAPGEVTAPPAKIEAMYEPQRFGLSGTSRITAAAKALGTGEVATAR